MLLVNYDASRHGLLCAVTHSSATLPTRHPRLLFTILRYLLSLPCHIARLAHANLQRRLQLAIGACSQLPALALSRQQRRLQDATGACRLHPIGCSSDFFIKKRHDRHTQSVSFRGTFCIRDTCAIRFHLENGPATKKRTVADPTPHSTSAGTASWPAARTRCNHTWCEAAQYARLPAARKRTTGTLCRDSVCHSAASM